MRTPRSSVAALVAAVSLPLLALAAGCGSDDTSAREPAFTADLARRASDPRGCVPNPRPAPRTDPRVPADVTPPGLVAQRVEIPPDPSSAPGGGAMVASATQMGIERSRLLEAPSEGPTIPDAPGPTLAADHAGDRFVVIGYRLRNKGSVPTTPDQIAGHLLLRDGGRWVAPSFGCAFAPGTDAAGTPAQEAGAHEMDAVPGNTRVAPGASVPAAAVYVVHGDGERWASSPTTAGATWLRPREGGPGPLTHVGPDDR